MLPPLARALAGVALACTLLGPVPAAARVVEFTCTVTFERWATPACAASTSTRTRAP